VESLTVVEVLGAHGEVVSRHRFVYSGADCRVSIGRAISCDVIVDDPRVAAEHLVLHCRADGSVTVTDPGSINGLTLNGRRVRGAREVRLIEPNVGLGRTRIRVRTLGETLAPEQPESAAGGQRRNLFLAGVAVAALAAFTSFETWVEAPVNITDALASEIMPLIMVVGIWTSLWAMLTRLNRSVWCWLPHLAIAGAALTGLGAGNWLLDVLAFAAQIRNPQTFKLPGLFLLVAGILFMHLRLATRIRPRRIAIATAALTGCVIALVTWIHHLSSERDVNMVAELGPIMPPALYLARGTPLSDFSSRLGALRGEADERRASALKRDPEPEEYGD
jgi:hypothetical protein